MGTLLVVIDSFSFLVWFVFFFKYPSTCFYFYLFIFLLYISIPVPFPSTSPIPTPIHSLEGTRPPLGHQQNLAYWFCF